MVTAYPRLDPELGGESIARAVVTLSFLFKQRGARNTQDRFKEVIGLAHVASRSSLLSGNVRVLGVARNGARAKGTENRSS